MVLLLAGSGYLLYRCNTDATDEAIEEFRVAYAREDPTEEEFEKRLKTLKQQQY